MKRFFPTFLLFFLFLECAYGQQPPQYSLYMFNPFQWNPAYAGLDHSLSITGVFRKQWVDLEGSPVSQHVNAHMPLYFLNGGIGLLLENDQLGAQRTTFALLAYNYQLDLGEGLLTFGLGGGLLQKGLDGTLLRTPEGEYLENIINHNDLLLSETNETAMAPTFNAGVYFQNEWLEAGLSTTQLTESPVSFNNFSVKPVRNYYFNAGMHLDLTRRISIHPSVLVRSDARQTQIDFSTIVRYNDNIFGGASFRGYNSNTTDAVAILLGLKLSENITMGYGYDMTLSELNTVSNGSHEIMLNYNLNKRIGGGRPPKIIYNPRSL